MSARNPGAVWAATGARNRTHFNADLSNAEYILFLLLRPYRTERFPGGAVFGRGPAMKAAGLADEFFAFARLPTPAERARLISLGVPEQGVWHGPPGTIGIANIAAEGPKFSFAESGPRVVVHPIWSAAYEVIDLVAWAVDRPGRWWLRTGEAVMLGEDALRAAYVCEVPLPVHRDPLRWWRANNWGVVILDPAVARFDLLHLAGIVAEDIAHGRELDRLMRGPKPPRPRIFVRKAEAA